MMDTAAADRLQIIGKAQEFEGWLAVNDAEIMRIAHLEPAQWTEVDFRTATAALLAQRLVLGVRKAIQAEREART
jgi:hypothetical protein